MPKKKVFDQGKEVRKLARERVGKVKPARPMDLKEDSRKPRHKKPITEETELA